MFGEGGRLDPESILAQQILARLKILDSFVPIYLENYRALKVAKNANEGDEGESK